MQRDDASTAESDDQHIRVGETTDGDPVRLPVVQVLTGRGFVTGKSGSGKSNTTSVVVEELLEAGYPVLIVDTDGEYYGLKEQYELLHAGADEECDIQVGAEHAEKLANLALEQNVPIILDVSGYLDEGEADELVLNTARHLFAKEKKLKKPFLLVVEECHEYIPEGGGMDETGKMFIKIGKRGRKHGLGVVGISQRPADVKKDFITQANWLVWHRLTWENDTRVVGRIVGSEYADEVPDLDAGEAFVQTDWTDEAVRRIQFKRKRTFDAGATPGLEDFERPELKSVSDALMDDLQDITEAQEREEERIAELEEELAAKEEEIAELERQLESARNVSAAARKMANAVSGKFNPNDARATLGAKNVEIDRLHDRVAELEDRLEAGDVGAAGEDGDDDGSDGDADVDDVDDEADGEPTVEEYVNEVLAGDGSAAAADGDEATGAEADDPAPTTGDDAAPATDEGVEILTEDADDSADWTERVDAAPEDLADLLTEPPVAVKVDAACRQSLCNEDHAEQVLGALVVDAPVTTHEVAGSTEVSVEAAYSLLSALRARDLVVRDGDRRYAFDPGALESLVAQADDRAHLGELREQWRVE